MANRGWRRVFRLDFGPRRVERDVNEEIAFHLEMRTRRLIESGVPSEQARIAALAQFGDLPGVRDECLSIGHDRERAMRISDLLRTVRQDAEYALRSLRKQPTFTLVVLLILAIGIGANTATFTLIDALLLRALPVPHAEQLVTIGDPSATGSMASGSPVTDYVSYPVYADVRDKATTVSGVYATGATGVLDVRIGNTAGNATSDAPAAHPRARFVSGSFFSVLQVSARIGRTFTADEDRVPGADPVVVISDTYWRRDFAADSSIVGRRMSINGVPVTVIGVTPPGFTGDVVGFSTDLWIPMMMQPIVAPYRNWVNDRSVSWLLMMGRLAPGKNVAQAKGEIAALELHSILDHATPNNQAIVESNLKDDPILVESGARGFSYYRSAYAQSLLVLMGAVLLVVLVVCANVANLMLARSASRAREISVRMALGAGRGRLVQQLLTECVVLAVAAGALSLVVANWAIRILLRVASGGPTPVPLDARLDARMLGYTAAVSLVMMTIFGVAPALRATRVELATSLRGQGRALNALGGGGHFGLGKWLVASQIALSTVLLLGAGMLIHSARAMATVDLGFDRDHVTVVSIASQKTGYHDARLAALMRDLVSRTSRVHGVTAASVSENGLFSGTESGTGIRVPGYEIRADSEKFVQFDAIGPSYFKAVGAHVLRGRDLDERDREGAARVVILNATAARFYFGSADPVGRSLTRSDSTYLIVGVVRDVEEQSVRAHPVRRAYFSIFQLVHPVEEFRLEVHTAGPPAQSVRGIRDAVLAADAKLSPTIDDVNSLVRQSTGQDTLVTQIISFFGALTLLLAALGLYGVMAYATARRTGEFGIRAALGAAPGSVTRMILGETLTLTAIGVAVGLPAGLAAARFIRGELFGVGMVDVPSLAGAVVVLAGAAMLAGYLPARRASRVGPLEALRAE